MRRPRRSGWHRRSPRPWSDTDSTVGTVGRQRAEGKLSAWASVVALAIRGQVNLVPGRQGGRIGGGCLGGGGRGDGGGGGGLDGGRSGGGGLDGGGLDGGRVRQMHDSYHTGISGGGGGGGGGGDAGCCSFR
eukprot:617321-Prymnesium_polylepis.1